MKTWDDLTDGQKESAVLTRMNWLLKMICDGSLKFARDDLQQAILDASEKAEKMKTPWFMHEYVMESIGDTLRALAQEEVRNILYIEPHEVAMEEPVVEH